MILDVDVIARIKTLVIDFSYYILSTINIPLTGFAIAKHQLLSWIGNCPKLPVTPDRGIRHMQNNHDAAG